VNWYLVFGIWYLVFGIWVLEFGIWVLVLGIRYLVFGIWVLVLGGGSRAPYGFKTEYVKTASRDCIKPQKNYLWHLLMKI
jgi:hypothetical protein